MAIFTNIPKLCSLTTGMNKSFHCYWSRLVKTTGLSQIHTFSHKKWTHSSRNLGRFLVLRHNPHILEWFLGMDLHWGSLLDGWNYHGTRKCRFPFRGRGAGNCRETAPGVGQRELIVGCFVLGVEKKIPSIYSTLLYFNNGTPQFLLKRYQFGPFMQATLFFVWRDASII